MKRTTLLAVAALGCAAIGLAEDSQKSEKEAPFEVFAGYSYLHEDGHILNGWTGTFIANVNSWLGVAADFDGHYRTEPLGGGQNGSLRENGFTFGPHVSFHNHSRVTPFAFALFGGAHSSFHSQGQTVSANGFAMNLGGGLDLRINEWLTARLIQADAAYTRFDGEGVTSPRLSTGLVFHFGPKK